MSYTVAVKSTVEISQNCVAFSEYMNFTKGQSYGSILIRISDPKFESLMDSKVEYLPKAERLKVYIFFMV